MSCAGRGFSDQGAAGPAQKGRTGAGLPRARHFLPFVRLSVIADRNNQQRCTCKKPPNEETMHTTYKAIVIQIRNKEIGTS